MRFTLAAAILLATAMHVQAQRAGHASVSAPSATAQLSARAAADAAQAAQALDMTATPNGQPAPLPDPNGEMEKNSKFDPKGIHYPYGHYSLGNVDPASAADPYSPYGSLPSAAGTYGHYDTPIVPSPNLPALRRR